jgi:hypothetical protein
MTPRRPPGLIGPMVVTMVVFLALCVTGIVLLIEDHIIGVVPFVLGIVVAEAFRRWANRRWAEHRRTADGTPRGPRA